MMREAASILGMIVGALLGVWIGVVVAMRDHHQWMCETFQSDDVSCGVRK